MIRQRFDKEVQSNAQPFHVESLAKCAKQLLPTVSQLYSCLKASTGFIFAARMAG